MSITSEQGNDYLSEQSVVEGYSETASQPEPTDGHGATAVHSDAYTPAPVAGDHLDHKLHLREIDCRKIK
jgi:hypothetical protein